jgi:ataxia telangiectasia mutated family protein
MVQVALNAVTYTQQLDGIHPELSTSEAFAHVLWDQGEKKSAIDALSRLLQEQLSRQSVIQNRAKPDLGKLAAVQAQLVCDAARPAV